MVESPWRPDRAGVGRPHERGGSSLPGLAGLLGRDAANRPPAVRHAPAALHGARQARVLEAPERGAAGSAGHLSADAGRGLHVDARRFASVLRRDGLGRFPNAGSAGGARRLRRSASRESAGIRPDPGAGPRGSRRRRALHGAALLRPATAPRAVCGRALSDRRRRFPGARRRPRGPGSLRRGQTQRTGHPADLRGAGPAPRRRAAVARGGFRGVPRRRLGPESVHREPPRPGIRLRRRPRARGRGPVGGLECIRPGVSVPPVRDFGGAPGKGAGLGADGRRAAGVLRPRDGPVQRGRAARTGAGSGAQPDLPGRSAGRSPAIRPAADRRTDGTARDLPAHRGASAQGLHLYARPASGEGRSHRAASSCARGRATASTSRRPRR